MRYFQQHNKLLKIIIFFTALIFFVNSTYANTLDSLRQTINSSHNDTVKIQALISLARTLPISNTDSAILLATQALKLSKNQPTKFQAKAHFSLGKTYRIKGDYQKALKHLNTADKMYSKLNLKKGLAQTMTQISVIYINQGNYPKALEHSFKALKQFQSLGDKRREASILGNIGVIYKNRKNYSEALKYHLKALKINKKTHNKRFVAVNLGNIGVVYKHKRNYPKALEYYFQALAIHKELNNYQGVARVSGNIANIYRRQNQIQKALDYYKKAIKIQQKLNAKSGLAVNFGNIGLLYSEKKQYNKAKKALDSALAISKELKLLPLQANHYNSLAKLYKAKAEEKINLLKRVEFFKKALFYNEKYIILNDSIFNEEKSKAIGRIEAKAEYDKQQAIAQAEYSKELEKQQALALSEKKQQNVVIASVSIGFVLVLIFAGIMFSRFKVTRRQRDIIEQQKLKVEQQNYIVKEKNKEIIDSINYAKRLQQAILPNVFSWKKTLPESFVLFLPKDIVSGDFYWMESQNNSIYFAVADCTGHGVPGAMVSVMCNNSLNRSLLEHNVTKPGEILDKTREILIAEFKKSGEEVNDGMDIALCRLQGNTLQYAGAHNPLWIIRNGELDVIKADKQPVGNHPYPQPFVTQTIELQKNDTIYIFSDGYVDQFGGKKGKKFKSKTLKEILLSIHQKSMDEQKEFLLSTFKSWKGSIEQIDDVCMIGIRI